MPKHYALETIKEKLDCVTFANRYLRLPVTAPGDRCVSFRPGARNPTSLLIDDRTWFDFGAGIGGDVIDLCAHAHHAGQLAPALAELSSILGLTPESPIPTQAHFDHIPEQVASWHTNLSPAHREYLHSRRISDETIDTLQIGTGDHGQHANRLIIPYWKAGRPVYLASRGEDPKYKKHSRTSYTDHPPWGADTLNRDGRVIIAEGAFDAISCYQEGLPILSPITGRFSRDQIKDVLSLLRGREVTVCMDFDPKTLAGQKFTIELAKQIFLAGIKVAVVLLPGSGVKIDLSDFYQQGHDIHAILADCVPFASYYIRDMAKGDLDHSKKCLKTFLRDATRLFEWPDVAEMIHLAGQTEQWSTIWLRELSSALKKAPSDHAVLDKLEKDHDLYYNELLGWYEYNRAEGVWRNRYETQIHSIIADQLAGYRTGSRITSATTVARAQFCNHTPFNEDSLINFRNGLLDTETMELRAHDRTAFSSIQLAHSFDPSAQCPNWHNFIADVTDNDEDRIRIIQQMFGYALTSDRRYQKAFFLLGDGGNGKSVLLNVLTAMVGHENVSNIEIASLNEPFQRICLYGKLLNIAAETESKVRGTETVFKQIVTGDTITGCKKGKDFITFRPSVLCVFAANEMAETGDLTKGFLRRLVFMRFPIEFVECPSEPHQRLKDRLVESRLIEELPGVTNWAIAGLHDLREADAFWETPDHHQLLRDFIALSSPLVLFLEENEYFMEDWISRADAYRQYANWSKDNNCHPISVRKFWLRLRNHILIEDGKAVGIRQVRRLRSVGAVA